MKHIDENNNGIDDRKEHDLNNNGIDDRKEEFYRLQEQQELKNKQFYLKQNNTSYKIIDANQDSISFAPVNENQQKGSIEIPLADFKEQLSKNEVFFNPNESEILEIKKDSAKEKNLEFSNDISVNDINEILDTYNYDNFSSDQKNEMFKNATYDYPNSELKQENINEINVVDAKTIDTQTIDVSKEVLKEIIENTEEKKLDTTQLPYDDFEKLGISKHELLNKFDTKDLMELMKMNKTNLVTLDLKDKALNFKVDAKLSLKQNPDNTYSLRVHPFRKEIENDYGISKKELEELKKGSIIEKDIKEPGKDKIQKVLFQLDKEINELIKVNKKDLELDKNVSKKLSSEQLRSVASGKTLTLKSSKGKGVTVKMDLNKVKGYTISTKDFLLNKKMDKGNKKDLAF